MTDPARGERVAVVGSDRSVVWPDGSRGGSYDEANQAVRFRRPVELRWSNGRFEPYTGKRTLRQITR